MTRNRPGRLSKCIIHGKYFLSYKASKIFNKQVFGQPRIPERKFSTYQYARANYLSPSLSIKLPIFSIHGNHDDPTGLDMLSSLDQACINHYLNYFGKVKNVEKIEVTPVLFERG
jgi:DNA repair exonuclease SbcCD nuclease subunit